MQASPSQVGKNTPMRSRVGAEFFKYHASLRGDLTSIGRLADEQVGRSPQKYTQPTTEPTRRIVPVHLAALALRMSWLQTLPRKQPSAPPTRPRNHEARHLEYLY